MTRRLTVAAVQPVLQVGRVDENIARIDELIRDAHRVHRPDVLVLPEAVTSPNAYEPAVRDVPRPVDGVVLSLLKQLSAELDSVIAAGSLSVRGDHAYGTYMLVEPDGRAHLHDKDIPSGTENFYYRGGDDDGVVAVAAWDRRTIGLVSGLEWARVRTARRLRAARVQFVLGGQCWPWTPVNWRGPIGRWSSRQHEMSQRLLEQTPSAMARLVGAPVVMASHAGDVTMRTPFLPGVPWRSPLFGETRICDSDGATLARLAGSDGEGHISATIELKDPTPSEPLPSGYWTVEIPQTISTMFHGFNAIGAAAYRIRHARRLYPWQDGLGADLPDETPPRPPATVANRRRAGLASQSTLPVAVRSRREAADGVVHLVLSGCDSTPLPPWKPGAHVDLHLGEGLVRQYSLCGDHTDGDYEIAVLREPAGSGGSAFVHDRIAEGDELRIGRPRNHFTLDVHAPEYLFIAGGIGITPMRAMIKEVDARKRPWRLAYGGRTAKSMAFAGELLRDHPDNVTLYPQDRDGLMPLERLLATGPEDGQIYCCGPEALLEAVEKLCAGRPSGTLRTERFMARPRDLGESDEPFEVTVASTGQVMNVPSHRSILDVLTSEGVAVDSSCRSGVCGSCEVGVLDGVPDHRDAILTHAGGDVSDRILTCVSRARSASLTLNL